MTRIIWILLLVALATPPNSLPAQARPRVEAFIGYSHLRLETGFQGVTGDGAIAGATYYFTDRLGVSADWSGHWFDRFRFESFAPPPEIGPTISESDSDTHHILVGPQFSVLQTKRFTINLRAAAGARRVYSSGSVQSPEAEQPELRERVEFSSSTWRAASSFGGSLDTALTRRVAWRVQPEVLYWYENGNQTDFRVSTGLVFRFGRR